MLHGKRYRKGGVKQAPVIPEPLQAAAFPPWPCGLVALIACYRAPMLPRLHWAGCASRRSEGICVNCDTRASLLFPIRMKWRIILLAQPEDLLEMTFDSLSTTMILMLKSNNYAC